MTVLHRLPEFLEKLPAWQRVDDLYMGKHSIVCSEPYLIKHMIEASKDADALKLWEARQRRTKYLKLPRIIKEVLLSFFYRKMPTLDEETSNLLGDDSKDIDGRGNSFETFIKLATTLLFRHGDLYVLVDAYDLTGRNRAQEKTLGLRPFMELIPATSIPEWDIESEIPSRIGKLNMLRHEYSRLLPRHRATDKIQEQMVSAERFLDDAGRYAIQRYIRDKDAKTDTGQESDGWKEDGSPIVTKLDFVPIARINAEPWLDEVCDESERILNIRSNRDNILYFQGYKTIYEIGNDEASDRTPSAEYIYRRLPMGASIAEVSEVQTDSYDRALEEGVNYAFKVGLMQLRSLPSDSRAVQGADTVAAEKDTSFARVEAAVEDLENCFNEALGYYAIFKGEKDFKGRIEFNKEIAPESFDEVIQIWQAFSDIFKRIDVVTEEVAKKAVKRIGLSPEGLKQAYAAIEKAGKAQPTEQPAQPDDQIAQALNG